MVEGLIEAARHLQWVAGLQEQSAAQLERAGDRDGAREARAIAKALRCEADILNKTAADEPTGRFRIQGNEWVPDRPGARPARAPPPPPVVRPLRPLPPPPPPATQRPLSWRGRLRVWWAQRLIRRWFRRRPDSRYRLPPR